MSVESLFSVAGKTALITGGARGVGLMIARGFVSAGAHVIITSRAAEAGEKAVAELSGLPGGGTCEALVADLSTEQGCRDLAAAVRERHERLDVLVNNAGLMGEMWMGKLSEAVWKDVMAVNVQAVFFLVRDLLPLLKRAATEENPARVVNIGSEGGSTTTDLDMYAYTASKAAVHHMTAHLARRLAPEITVNAVAPGPLETDMTAMMLKLFGSTVIGGIPLKRICTPDDIVGAVMFLASRAGAYLTGAVIPLDGGTSTT